MNHEIGNDEEPGESRTITVRWEGEQSETANEFIRSLGFDPQTWEGEGTCELALGATFKVFGMDLPVSEKLREVEVWECHTEKRAEGVGLLVINDAAVGGSCENLTDITPLAGLTQLTSLDLSYCDNLTDITPLAGLAQLTSLDLEWCGGRFRGVALSALSELTQLNFLALTTPPADLTPLASLTNLRELYMGYSESFAKMANPEYCISDISALSGLTQLTYLSLANCSFLTDLNPLARLTRLTFVDLQGCRNLTDLTPLAGLTRLKTLHLENCLYLMREDKLAALSGLRELRELDYVPPHLGLSILLGAAVSREDAEICCKLLRDAPEILAKGQNPDLAVTAARACRCAGESLDPGILANLLDTTLGLTTVAPEHWGEILGELSQETSALLESWLDALAGADASESFLAGFLDRVAAGWCPSGWQPEHLAGRLDHWLESRAAAELSFLGPRICLAWRRLGRADREQAWLERLTDPADPSFRDRVRAAFALADIEHGRRAEAADLLREIQQDVVADPVRVALARALAADAPEEAGGWLEEIDDAQTRTDLATELGGREGFRAVEENLRRLLVILGTDPARFLELLGELAGRDPDNAWLTQLREELLPRPEGPGFVEEILARLDHPAVAEMTKPRQLQQLKQSLSEDTTMLDPACDELVVSLLEKGGLIDDEEASDLRSSLGNGAAD